MAQPPPDIVSLAERRSEARRQRDYATSDELRDQLLAAGWEVLDRAGGSDLQPVPVAPAASVLTASILIDGVWAEDAARFRASVERHVPTGTVELVGIPAGESFALTRNAALAEATADVVVLVDTSLELTGDVVTLLVDALADPTVALAGPFGLVTADLCDYEERTEGDVAAIQGYCLAARRADLLAIGALRETFAYYRNADIDLSFRLRTQGPGLYTQDVRRAVAVGADRCARHTHRAWEETPPDERDRLSRRNMGKIHDRFFTRRDLTVP